MAKYFVTRHKGAVEWARAQGIEARHLEHLDVDIIKKGDHVLGTLPVSVAAEINFRGAHYFHLTLNLPPQMRGKELSVDDMVIAGAKLAEYEVRKKGQPQ